ncbi:metallophosphoesterase [Dasania marina]|uniref:metallophosphoesterase n=1 Tax=Dasania marina TaxID=471499 RepID=UPI00036D6023|nr:metallophosphoesterase [Dasania marina]
MIKNESEQYDIIGDIHGHGDELIKLLEHMGYQLSESGYCHPNRKVIFLGDFIDRGEQLRQHQRLLNVVMPMVNNGHALAVMGNHEFNALAFHTKHEGEPLRSHTVKNIEQHQAFLNEYQDEPALKQTVLDFFWELPIWLELDGLRVIHACWHDEHIKTMKDIAPKRKLTHEILVEASTEGTAAYEALEVLLKGIEVELPEGIIFKDKGGHERTAVRVQWWNNGGTKLGDITAPTDIDIGDAADLPIPEHVRQYCSDAPPCFIGHYWLKGEPAPLAPNVACLDYSIAKEGKLVAYRWDGEHKLVSHHFSYVEN